MGYGFVEKNMAVYDTKPVLSGLRSESVPEK